MKGGRFYQFRGFLAGDLTGTKEIARDVLFLTWRAQARIFKLFPLFLKLTIELAGQRFHRDVSLRAEIAPENKAQKSNAQSRSEITLSTGGGPSFPFPLTITLTYHLALLQTLTTGV